MVPAVRFTRKRAGALELSLHEPRRRGCHVRVLEGADWWRCCAGEHCRESTSRPRPASLATEERLAAWEEEVAKLRLRVAELEEHSSGAATG